MPSRPPMRWALTDGPAIAGVDCQFLADLSDVIRPLACPADLQVFVGGAWV